MDSVDVFNWIGSDSVTYSVTNTQSFNWQMRYMEPTIESGEFEFTIKINTCARTNPFMVGVCSKDHESTRGSHFGRRYGYGWNAYSSNGIYYGQANGNSTSVSIAGFETGDQLTFKVNKSEKTVEFLKNGASLHKLDNQDFPDEMQIGISLYRGPINVELVDFVDYENPFFGSKFGQHLGDEMMEETKERLEYVVEHCGNFLIPLRNKTLNLWKPFLFHSNIKGLGKIERYEGLEDLKLEVDEFSILQFLLGYNNLDENKNNNNNNLEKLLDYFRFFQRLGMKNEMLRILGLLSVSPQGFKECYDLFLTFTKEFETNEEIRSWFTSSPKMMDPPFPFSSCLSLALFNRMRHFFNELSFESPLMFLPHINIIGYHLKKYKTLKDITPIDSHPEISSTTSAKNVKLLQELTRRRKKKKGRKKEKEESLPEIYKVLSRLFQMRHQKITSKEHQHQQQQQQDYLSNLTVITSDEKEIPVHREVLIVRSNFFFKMLSFGGRETQEMEKEAKVRLVDLKYKEAMTLIRFFYTGQVLCPDLETFIICLDHAHKYFEEDYLVHKLLLGFSEMASNLSNRRRVLECFKRTGHLLQDHEELKELVIESLLGKKGKKSTKSGLSKKHILDALRKAEKKNFEDVVIQENKELKKRVKGLEDQIAKILKDFDEVKKRVKKLERGKE